MMSRHKESVSTKGDQNHGGQHLATSKSRNAFRIEDTVFTRVYRWSCLRQVWLELTYGQDDFGGPAVAGSRRTRAHGPSWDEESRGVESWRSADDLSGRGLGMVHDGFLCRRSDHRDIRQEVLVCVWLKRAAKSVPLSDRLQDRSEDHASGLPPRRRDRPGHRSVPLPGRAAGRTRLRVGRPRESAQGSRMPVAPGPGGGFI